jgi:hypothetical protein
MPNTAIKANTTTAVCPAFPGLCTETAPGHDDHSNHQHAVTTSDGSRLLDIGFINLSDGSGPLIYLSGASTEDLHPGQVRARTAELRRLLDEADAIADTIQRMQGTAVPAPSERAFTHARTAIDAAVEASADPKGTALALRTYAAMTADELTNPAA